MTVKRNIVLLLSMLFIGRICAQSYLFKNVQIHGGGFVTGLVYNPTVKNLLYARTDVGGAYRWDAGNQVWIPLNDNLSVTQNNYTGVISLATDPVDTNRVYIATGLYTPSWAGTGAIFASQDKGNTWTEHDLTIKFGGNENGRSAGEKLQVDPNKDNILFLGTSQDGLWKSTDMGVTWSQVTTFPNATANVSFVQFKKSSGVSGSATPVIYVGLLQTGTNFYKSADGGATWAAVAGAPTAYMPHRAALSSTGILYLAYSDNTGPNNVTGGQVWKWNTTSAVWTQIPPPYTQGGYAGITVDAQNPNTIMVSTMDRWSPRDEVYRSTNGGTTWTALLTPATWSYTQAPYVSAQTPSWIGDVEIDPFNSANAWFVTGYGLFTSANATATPVTWSFSDTGIEELDVAGLISPPSGLSLLSVVGDQDGFRHSSLTATPAGKYSPAYGTHTSIDFAENNPNYLVKTHYNSTAKYGGYSTDQGVSWTSFGSYPASSTGGGTVAVSANNSTIVLSANGAAVSYSTNNGTSWTASTGISSGLAVVADRVTSTKFYAYDAANGNILVSTNSGASFSTAATGFNVVPGYYLWATGMKAVYGIAGDVWMHNLDGLFHSTNSGASFTQIANVSMTYQVAFGKPKTGNTYPAIYIVGSVSGVYGFYRSDDTGATWVRINDASHQYGTINVLSGDPNAYGRVYLGTAGRGIIYGDVNLSLPVVLDWFKATPVSRSEKTMALLQWQTATEISNGHYTIEKSANGAGWSVAGTVNALAGSNGHVYSYEDDISSLNGTIYYRLLTTDPDGNKQYSSIASIKHTTVLHDFITVYPNPVMNNTCNVNIHVEQNKTVYLELTTTDGRQVYKSGSITVFAGNNMIPVTPINQLPAGTYIIEAWSSGEKIGTTVIIK